MDRETKVELGAIPLTLGILAVIFAVYAAAAGGIWWWLVVGILIVAALVSAVRWAVPRSASGRESLAAPAERVDDGTYRILVVTCGVCGPELQAVASGHPAAHTKARVLSVVSRSRLAVWTGDEASRREAETHLQQTLELLTATGVDADGVVTTATPLRAADEGLSEFPADEVVFALEDGTTDDTQQLLKDAATHHDIRVSAIHATRSITA